MGRKILLCLLSLCLLLGPLTSASAGSKPTPTPPPVEMRTDVLQPPEEIQQVLDVAYQEWSDLAASGKYLENKNKYTKWRGPYGFGWCGGFVTWCLLECGIPMAELEDIEEAPVEGLFHVKEASVGKIQRGYQKMGRTCIVPQPGFLIVYAVRKSANYTTHIGIVYDVEDLGGGKYRLTTIEGNMSKRVKMYVHDYDMYAKDWTKNLSEIPEEARTRKEDAYFNYRLQMDTWYVNRFLMPWVPDENTPTKAEAVAAAVEPSPMPPTPGPTLAPTLAPTEPPTASPTEPPTAAPTEMPTEAPTEAPTSIPTASPEPTPIPEPTQTPIPLPAIK